MYGVFGKFKNMEKFFYILLFIFISCAAKKNMDKNIEFIITMEQSYKYDLKNEIYTIYGVKKYDSIRKTYFVSGTPLEIKFNLSEEEKTKIKKKYYDLGIDEMPTKMIVNDSCFAPFPRMFYTLYVYAGKKRQNLNIDIDCDAYGYPNYYKGIVLKNFLNFCLTILRTKPEIKNSPKSYWPYH